MFWLPAEGSLHVADPGLAMMVLRDPDHCYGEVSEFFGTPGGGVLSPRAVQAAVGHAARRVLQAHLSCCPDRLRALVAELGPDSVWPAAGHDLMYRFWGEVVLRPDGTPRLRRLLGQVAGRHAWSLPSSHMAEIPWHFLRVAALRAAAAEIRRRRANGETGGVGDAGGGEPDLLGAIIGAVPPDTAPLDIAQVYMKIFRSAVVPVGDAVAWTLLAAAREGVALDAYPAVWSVQESLRLWPVAWFTGRRVHRAHQIGGVRLEPGDSVTLSAYLLHRDERHWPHATRFQPDRWAAGTRRGPYLPFGAGPFACAGAAVARALAAETVTALTQGARLSVAGGQARPYVQGIISPPRFHLRRDPRPAPRGARKPAESSSGRR
ncbi:cytochrome P450 [Actinomadura kijaniata]